MARFQPVLKRARYSTSGITADQMLRVATALQVSIVNRIHSGLDVNDSPAKALSAKGKRGGYAAYKGRKSPPALRNWWFTGRTLRSLKVLSYSANRAVIGFTDATANLRAYINNRRWRQFGVSPKDRAVLVEAVRDALHQSVSAGKAA